MQQWSKRYQVYIFVIAIGVISGLLLGLHVLFPLAGQYSISFPQFGPSLAVVVMGILLKDQGIWKEIKRRCVIRKKDYKYVGSFIVMPLVLVGIVALVLEGLNEPYQLWGTGGRFYITNLFFMLIGCIGEEIGWRGFLLSQLQKKHTMFISSLIVGLIWGIWHLNFQAGFLGFMIYILNTVLLSVLMTWLFNKTEGNISLMIVWHFMINVGFHILLWNRDMIMTFSVISILYGIVIIIGYILHRFKVLD